MNWPTISRHVLVDCRLCVAWKTSHQTCVTTIFRFSFLFTHQMRNLDQMGSREGRES